MDELSGSIPDADHNKLGFMPGVSDVAPSLSNEQADDSEVEQLLQTQPQGSTNTALNPGDIELLESATRVETAVLTARSSGILGGSAYKLEVAAYRAALASSADEVLLAAWRWRL